MLLRHWRLRRGPSSPTALIGCLHRLPSSWAFVLPSKSPTIVVVLDVGPSSSATEIGPKSFKIRQPILVPHSTENQPKSMNFWWFLKPKLSQIDPWRPQAGQEGPKRVPGGSPGNPRGAPRRPRAAPWGPQGRPRELQGSPKDTQELPEAPPRWQNRAQNVPKIDLEADFGRKAHSKPIFG